MPLQRLGSHALVHTRANATAAALLCVEEAATPSSSVRWLSTSLVRRAEQAWLDEMHADEPTHAIPMFQRPKTLEERQEELVHFLHMAGQETKKMWPQNTKFEHCAHKPWSLVCNYMRTTLTSPTMVDLWRKQLDNEINFTKELAEQLAQARRELARVGRLTSTGGAKQLIAQWTGPLEEALRKEFAEVCVWVWVCVGRVRVCV